MPKGKHLGEFEVLVMLAIARLGKGAYGMAIRDEIERRSDRDVARAAVYVTLQRLEKQGLVRTHKEDPDKAVGVARRFATVTPAGIELLKANKRVLEGFWEGLPILTEPST